MYIYIYLCIYIYIYIYICMYVCIYIYIYIYILLLVVISYFILPGTFRYIGILRSCNFICLFLCGLLYVK